MQKKFPSLGMRNSRKIWGWHFILNGILPLLWASEGLWTYSSIVGEAAHLECQISSGNCICFYSSLFTFGATLYFHFDQPQRERTVQALGKMYTIQCFIWLKSSQTYKFGLCLKVEYLSFLSPNSLYSK